MKRFSKLILIIIIFTNILIFTENITWGKETTSPRYFGISEMMTGDTPNMGYAIGEPGQTGGITIWNIQEYTSATSNDPTELNAFCLKSGIGFTTDGSSSAKSYNVFYDMKTERDQIKAQNDVLKSLVEETITIEDGTTISRYDALLAAIDMLY